MLIESKIDAELQLANLKVWFEKHKKEKASKDIIEQDKYDIKELESYLQKVIAPQMKQYKCKDNADDIWKWIIQCKNEL